MRETCVSFSIFINLIDCYFRWVCCVNSAAWFSCEIPMFQVRRLQEEHYYLKEQVGEQYRGTWHRLVWMEALDLGPKVYMCCICTDILSDYREEVRNTSRDQETTWFRSAPHGSHHQPFAQAQKEKSKERRH